MIRNKVLSVVTCSLLVGLVACNNADNNALDDRVNNGYGALENRYNDDILNTRDDNRVGVLDTRNNRNNVNDHDRLFGTRDTNRDNGMYGVRGNNPDRTRNDNGSRGLYGTRNADDNAIYGNRNTNGNNTTLGNGNTYDNEVLTNNDRYNRHTGIFGTDRGMGGNDYDNATGDRNNNDRPYYGGSRWDYANSPLGLKGSEAYDMDRGNNVVIEEEMGTTSISNDKTNIPSSKFPHTKAVLIQEAKFKFVKSGEGQGKAQGQGNRHFKFLTGAQGKQGATGQQQQQQPAQQQEQQQPAQQQPAQQQEQQQPAQQQEQQQPAQQQEQQQPAQQEQPAKEQETAKQAPAQGISQAEQKVIDLTNAERRKAGLPDLKADTSLSNVAREKSNDMQKNNYFSHTSPTYGSPFDMMRDFGVSYKTAGENIAQGQQTPEQVVQAWMNSEGHRKNIMSKDFTHIGVGYQQSGHHWTQMFIGK